MAEENVITWVTADAFVPGASFGALGASYAMYWLSSAALNNTYYKRDAPGHSSLAAARASSSASATPARQTRERGCFE